MAALPYANQPQEDARWDTVDDIVGFLSPKVYKTLSAAVDALVDPTVADPARAYTIQ